MSTHGTTDEDLLLLTADIVSSHVSNNTVGTGELTEVIRQVYGALKSVAGHGESNGLGQKPAVPVNASVTPDAIICLEDGKPLKMLKRHLMSQHNLTIDEYRAKWSLPGDYPVVAPKYAKKRQELAKDFGLGRRR